MRMLKCADSGLLVEVDDLEHVMAMYDVLAMDMPLGVTDVVPGCRTLLLKLDPTIAVHQDIELAVRAISPARAVRELSTRVVIPVVYDGEDLAAVAEMTGLSENEVIKAHTSVEWAVAFCGFAPGFAYLTGGDRRIQVPRNVESRVKVPAGSVGLAGVFSGVYPRESPGGWQLIGRTDVSVWSLANDPPALLRPGVQVKFEKSV